MYVIEITQGETLFLELNVRDEVGDAVDLTPAVKSVQVQDPLVADSFTLTGTGSTLKLRADGIDTGFFPAGQYNIQIWLDWGSSADIEHEIIFEFYVKVRSAL